MTGTFGIDAAWRRYCRGGLAPQGDTSPPGMIFPSGTMPRTPPRFVEESSELEGEDMDMVTKEQETIIAIGDFLWHLMVPKHLMAT